MAMPEGIPVDQLSVTKIGRMPNYTGRTEFFGEHIGYSIETPEGTYQVCAECDLAFANANQVMLHRGEKHVSNRQKAAMRKRDRVEIPEQRDPPKEHREPPPEPGLSDIELPGVLGQWVSLAETMFARTLRSLIAQRDDALAKVDPLERENDKLNKENDLLAREIKRLERELAPFRKAAERMAERIMREANAGGTEEN